MYPAGSWTSIPNDFYYCSASVSISTGLFREKFHVQTGECSLPNFNFNSTDASYAQDIDCTYDYDDDSYECYMLSSSQSAAKAAIAFAVMKLVASLFPLSISWNNDVQANSLKSAIIILLILSFCNMISCFTATGNYRNFLLSETTWTDGYGYEYYVDWTMQGSWYLMLFGGIFNISMMVSSFLLLYKVSRLNEQDDVIYSTRVIVTPVMAQPAYPQTVYVPPQPQQQPQTVYVIHNPVAPAPQPTVVQGQVVHP